VAGVPRGERFSQSAAQLVKRGLSNQGHRHLAVADVEVQSSSAFPAERLMSIEELLDVPPLGVV
jgi:hypothetical protein